MMQKSMISLWAKVSDYIAFTQNILYLVNKEMAYESKV